MKEIVLKSGHIAIVDDDDYETVSAHKWHANVKLRSDGTIRDIYAITNIKTDEGKKTTLKIHRLIMRTSKGVDIDHIDGNGLNNQRNNLRECSRSENNCNQHRFRGVSKLKGVCWSKYHKRWKAQIRFGTVNTHIGYFASELDAARAYDAAALKYFGVFARINTYDD